MSIEKTVISAHQLALQEFSECNNLHEVVLHIENQFKSQGRVVCGVTVNGLRLNDVDETRLAGTLKADISFIEVETESPAQLLTSTLTGQIDLIEEIDRVAQMAAMNYRKGEMQVAHDQLLSVFDACRWLTDALVAVKGAPSWLPDFAVDESVWISSQASFFKVTNEMMLALEKSDFVLLSDLLEYELANSLAEWRELLRALLAVVP